MSLVNVTLDDFAPAFNYSSGWTATDTSAPQFQANDPFLESLVDYTYHSTLSTSATVTLSFTGSAIFIYGVAGPSQGSATYLLDNAPVRLRPLSAYAATNSSNYLLYSATGLTEGPHQVLISNAGNAGISNQGSGLTIDYALATISVGAEGATLTNTTVDDTNQSILTYSGTWNSNNDTRFLGGSSSFTNTDASVALEFEGSAVYVFGDTVNDHGLYSVTLDGETSIYNANTAELKFNTTKFYAGNLGSGSHRLEIRNIPGERQTFFDLDSIIFTTPSQFADGSSPATNSMSSIPVNPTTASGRPAGSPSSTAPNGQSASAAAANPSSSPVSKGSRKTRSAIGLFLGLLAFGVIA